MRHFFKPTLAKVALTLTFIGLASFLPHFSRGCAPVPPDAVAKYEGCSSVRVFGIGFPHFYGDYFFGDYIDRGLFRPDLLVVNLLLYYVIASTMMSLVRRTHTRYVNN